MARRRSPDRSDRRRATALPCPCYGTRCIAQELLCWVRLLCLDSQLALAEPKKLRHRPLHVAGRLARHGRSTRLRLQSDWPWTQALVAAFAKLRSIPALR